MPEISPELLSLRSYIISAELLWTMFARGGELLCCLVAVDVWNREGTGPEQELPSLGPDIHVRFRTYRG
jgi:hypothetical protein